MLSEKLTAGGHFRIAMMLDLYLLIFSPFFLLFLAEYIIGFFKQFSKFAFVNSAEMHLIWRKHQVRINPVQAGGDHRGAPRDSSTFNDY